jgi:Ca-activated chloride channel family protein
MSVITFDENPKITPFTDDKTALEQSIKSVRVHFGYTALFSSISTMLDDLNQQRGRKILVLVSDGNDNLGHTKIDEVIQKMVKSEDLTVVILGTVATYLPQVPYDKIEILNKGKKILQKMADSTAGYAFFPKTLNDVKKVQDLIRSFVRSQYSVAYRPANRKFDGKWRKIKITCSRKNVQLHYRQGYYDTH